MNAIRKPALAQGENGLSAESEGYLEPAQARRREQATKSIES